MKKALGPRRGVQVADDKKSGWDRVFEELKDPWDWAAAFIGDGGGAVVTAFTHGLDMGHSIPTGALGAVGARRAAVAGLQRRTLKKRAERLLSMLHEQPGTRDLGLVLLTEFKKWDLKITDSEKFSQQMEEISDLHSKRIRDSFLPPGVAVAAAVPVATGPKPDG